MANLSASRQQDQALVASVAPKLGAKGIPTGMPAPVHGLEIIHAGPPHPPVVEQEAAGLDNVDVDTQAGRETQDRPGVLRNIRLIESEAHG